MSTFIPTLFYPDNTEIKYYFTHLSLWQFAKLVKINYPGGLSVNNNYDLKVTQLTRT